MIALILGSASGIRDRFSRLAAGGIAMYFAAHFMINVSVNLGLIPMTGITLPLFSTGGSSLLDLPRPRPRGGLRGAQRAGARQGRVPDLRDHTLPRSSGFGYKRREVSSVRWFALALGVGIAGAIAAGFSFFVRRAPPTTRLVRPEAPWRRSTASARYAGAWDPATAPPGRRHLPAVPIPESLGAQLFPIHNQLQLWGRADLHPAAAERGLPCRLPRVSRGRFRFRTNSLGLRERGADEDEARPAHPVTGDSRTEGVCNNVESFTSSAGRSCAAIREDDRVPERGAGFFTFYNYLGTLEKYSTSPPTSSS